MPSILSGKRVLSFLNHRPVRASASTSLSASTIAPTSGIAAINNSQGASVAALELGRMLDCALRDGQVFGDREGNDDEGEADGLSARLKVELSRLDRGAGLYSNARLSKEIKSRTWSCSESDAHIIKIAMSCAVAVYEAASGLEIEGVQLRILHNIEAAKNGVIKATAFTIVDELDLLVVAIRGSANVVDHVVNMNGEVTVADNLVNLAGLSVPEKSLAQLYCHAGFLNGARALLSQVTTQIRTHKMRHVLFCGHSAGGAVAALLYVHFLSNANRQYPESRFSIITFGAPPVTCPDLTPFIKSDHPNASHRGLTLALVNEFDVVTRADRSYVRSLVDLYLSSLNHPPASDSSLTVGTKEPSLSSSPSTDSQIKTRPSSWTLPQPDFWNLGELILLKGEIVTSPVGDPDTGGSVSESRLSLWAHPAEAADFNQTLFCRVPVHSRLAYGESVDEIWKGRLNGRSGWE